MGGRSKPNRSRWQKPRMTGYSLLLLVGCTLFAAVAQGAGPPAISSPLAGARSRAQLAELERRAGLVRDASQVKRLQRIYGYYLDRSAWDEVVDLLTDDVTVEYGTSGVYVGKAQARALLYAIGYGKVGLRPGQIREHIQLQPVMDVATDGMTAKGRWSVLALLGQYREYARWQTGPYENEYRKEDGRWKISKIHWYETFTVPFEGGWKMAMIQSNVADRKFPTADRPPSFVYAPWPAVSLPPYHYTNPSAGRPRGLCPVQPGSRNRRGWPGGVHECALAALQAQVPRLVTSARSKSCSEPMAIRRQESVDADSRPVYRGRHA